MVDRVYITGMGVITSIGLNASENFASLKNSRHGITPISILNYSKHTNCTLAGEIKKTNEELKNLANLQNIESNSRTTLLALIAVKEALRDANLSSQEIANSAIISGTSVGGMDLFEQGYTGVIEQKIQNANFYFLEHDCGNINYKIAQEIGASGYMATISTACSSSANAIMLGARLIKAGLTKRAIVGGSDALSKFTINGFNTLGILDKDYTKPFDENRAGLNLGEGAAYLVLEAEDVCKNKKKYASISGYGNANDAFHQTASSENGKGATLAIHEALSFAKLQPNEIDYVNTHGTGTPNNDLAEGNALINTFKDSPIPPFNSLKPFIGHTLAACGSIEAAYSIFSINENILFKSLNFKQPIQSTNLTPIANIYNPVKVDHVLSNSFGFGGNCTSIIFSKAQ